MKHHDSEYLGCCFLAYTINKRCRRGRVYYHRKGTPHTHVHRRAWQGMQQSSLTILRTSTYWSSCVGTMCSILYQSTTPSFRINRGSEHQPFHLSFCLAHILETFFSEVHVDSVITRDHPMSLTSASWPLIFIMHRVRLSRSSPICRWLAVRSDRKYAPFSNHKQTWRYL